MRILVISQMFPCRRHPTSAIFFANLMKELAPKVDELIIVTPRPYIPRLFTKLKKSWRKWHLDPMVSKQDGMEIIRPYVLSLRGTSFSGLNGLLMHYSLLRPVRNLLKTRNIELILGYNMIPEGIAAVRLAKAFKLPVGFWGIGTDVNTIARYNRVNWHLTKKCAEESDIILSESEDLGRKIKTFSQKAINVQTFYKGIDVSNFNDLPPRDVLMKKLRLNPGKRYLLFVGRLIYDKGIHELAQAYTVIAKKYPDVNLILIGEEIEKETLVEKFKNENILDKIIFTGIIPFKEVAYYMKVATVLVFPTWAEGLPNVVMEAMASGLPVVASDVDGIPEVLEDRITGLSVPARNLERLTEAMIEMIENEELRTVCINNAKQLISESFDVKKNASHLYHLLENLKKRSHQSFERFSCHQERGGGM